jgi:hypothetical protein
MPLVEYVEKNKKKINGSPTPTYKYTYLFIYLFIYFLLPILGFTPVEESALHIHLEQPERMVSGIC